MNETEFSCLFSTIAQLFSYRNPKEDVYCDLIESDIDLIRKYNRNNSILFYTHFNNKNNNTNFSLMFSICKKINYYIEG